MWNIKFVKYIRLNMLSIANVYSSCLSNLKSINNKCQLRCSIPTCEVFEKATQPLHNRS